MSEDTFICIDCGKPFESLPPPADTRRDDPEPKCDNCIERMLDGIEAEPLTESHVQRIMRKVRIPRRGE